MPSTDANTIIGGLKQSPVKDVPIAAAADGALLSYTDDGYPGNVGPANVAVGGDGFLPFKSYSAGANAVGENRIYAVNSQGQLLSFADNGAPGNVNPSDPVVVGFGGWLQFKFLFAGSSASGQNRIYAVNGKGQLLSYSDNGTPGNVGPAHVVVGADGWDQFSFLFAKNVGGDHRIYAVNGGNLLSYQDNGAPGNVSHPVAVGVGGWDQFAFVFAGRNAIDAPCIYAVNQEGQLLAYTDNGTPGNVSHPVEVGYGAWLEFQYLFAGANTAGQNRIYAVTKAPGPGPVQLPPSLSAFVEPYQSNSALRIQGNNFGSKETVEITVGWIVANELSATYVLTAKADQAGYFVIWFTGNTSDGLCPISVPVGQPQPPQNFTVSARGLTSSKTVSANPGPFTCA